MMNIHHTEEINTIKMQENIQTVNNPGKTGLSPDKAAALRFKKAYRYVLTWYQG